MTCRAVAVAGVVLLAVSCVFGSDATESFVLARFGKPVPVRVLPVTGDTSAICSEVLGRPYAGSSVSYHTDGEQTVWILSARGKHGSIVAGCAVAGGTLQAVQVLADREVRGRGIRTERYLRQYQDCRLTKSGRLSRSVDGITGATMSSGAVKKIAVLALRLDDHLMTR